MGIFDSFKKKVKSTVQKAKQSVKSTYNRVASGVKSAISTAKQVVSKAPSVAKSVVSKVTNRVSSSPVVKSIKSVVSKVTNRSSSGSSNTSSKNTRSSGGSSSKKSIQDILNTTKNPITPNQGITGFNMSSANQNFTPVIGGVTTKDTVNSAFNRTPDLNTPTTSDNTSTTNNTTNYYPIGGSGESSNLFGDDFGGGYSVGEGGGIAGALGLNNPDGTPRQGATAAIIALLGVGAIFLGGL